MLIIEFFLGLILVFAIGYAIGYVFKLNPNRDLKGQKDIKKNENVNTTEINQQWKE